MCGENVVLLSVNLSDTYGYIIKGVLVFKELYYHCSKCKIYLYTYVHGLLSCFVINHKAHTVQNLFNRIIECVDNVMLF
jgi:hypothetical protein